MIVFIKNILFKRILHISEKKKVSYLAKKKLGDLKIEINFNQIRVLCRNFHISSLKLFGSILTEFVKDSSDIDILIKFESGFTPGFFKFIEIQRKLSLLFDNRKVDLRTENDLSRYFRQEVIDKAVEIFG